MDVELVPAATLGSEELAALFTAVYAGYWHPIALDADAFERMVATNDLDLAASRVAMTGGRAIGVAVLGVRDRTGWVGGMGVLPERRGEGLGARLTAALLDAAVGRSVETVRLEVLEQNAPAIAIYRRLGFEPLRDVVVWQLGAAPAAADASAVEDFVLDEALERLAAAELDAAWQRAPGTIRNMRAAGASLAAVRLGPGVAVFATGNGHASLLELTAPDTPTAAALLAAPFARGATGLLWLNGLEEGVVATALRDAGAVALARQHELVLRLGARSG